MKSPDPPELAAYGTRSGSKATRSEGFAFQLERSATNVSSCTLNFQRKFRGALWFKREAFGNETFSNTYGI